MQNQELLKQILEKVTAIQGNQQQHQAAVAEALRGLDKRIEDAFARSKVQGEDIQKTMVNFHDTVGDKLTLLTKQVQDLATCQNSDNELIKLLRDRTDEHGSYIRESLELLRTMKGPSRHDLSDADQMSEGDFDFIEEPSGVEDEPSSVEDEQHQQENTIASKSCKGQGEGEPQPVMGAPTPERRSTPAAANSIDELQPSVLLMGARTHEPGSAPTAADAKESCSRAQEGTPAPKACKLQRDPSCEKFSHKLSFFETEITKRSRSASAAESAPSAARSARPAQTPASSATATEWKQLETYDGIDRSDLEASAKLSLRIKGILNKQSLYVPLHED